MDNDQLDYCKGHLRRKLGATIDEIDTENLKKKEKEREIEENFNFFSDKICDILITSKDIFDEYKKSESLKNLKNSDEIRKIMKKYIVNLEQNELLLILEKIKDFEFDEEIKSIIKSETLKNFEIFIEEYKSLKKAKALEIIGQIKSDFESKFKTLEFHTIEFEKKISEQMIDFCFEEEHKERIIDLIKQIMIQKFKDLIKNELKYFN